MTVIRDYPRATVRSCTALSDKYFLQSFALRDQDGNLIGPRPRVVIQLRQYLRDPSSPRMGFTEKTIPSREMVREVMYE